ncbi:hypothetical protein LF933_20585, partial [Pectobacterium polaris]|nr:hypothetical protein [Pectobacterium polaris]
NCLRCQGMRALILQLSKSSIYSTKPVFLSIVFYPDSDIATDIEESVFIASETVNVSPCVISSHCCRIQPRGVKYR